MNETEAGRMMLDGEVGSLGGNEYRWWEGCFQWRCKGASGGRPWVNRARLPRSDRWEIQPETQPEPEPLQETVRWDRALIPGLSFWVPSPPHTGQGPSVPLSKIVDDYGTRIVGYEFMGYKDTYPNPIMWEMSEALHVARPLGLDLSRRRVAVAAILLKE